MRRAAGVIEPAMSCAASRGLALPPQASHA